MISPENNVESYSMIPDMNRMRNNISFYLSIYGVDLKKVVVTSSNMTKLLVYTVKSQKCVYLQVIKIRIKSSSFVHVVQPPQ